MRDRVVNVQQSLCSLHLHILLLQLLSLLMLLLYVLLLMDLPLSVTLCKYAEPPALNHVSSLVLLPLLPYVTSTLSLSEPPGL